MSQPQEQRQESVPALRSAEDWFVVGRQRERDGDLPGALAAYGEAVGREPDRGEWVYRQGCVLRKAGQLEDAATAFARAVDIDGGEARYLTNLGVALDGLGRREEAMRVFHRAILADAANAEAHHNLGAIYAEQGRDREAIRCFESALAASPDVDGWLNLGLVHFRAGEYGKALDCFRSGLLLAPDHPPTRFYEGRALMKKGLYAEAVASFRMLPEEGAERRQVLFHLGVCLHKLERYEDALEPLRGALEAMPGEGRLHYQLALTYDAMHLPDEARRHYALARS